MKACIQFGQLFDDVPRLFVLLQYFFFVSFLGGDGVEIPLEYFISKSFPRSFHCWLKGIQQDSNLINALELLLLYIVQNLQLLSAPILQAFDAVAQFHPLGAIKTCKKVHEFGKRLAVVKQKI